MLRAHGGLAHTLNLVEQLGVLRPVLVPALILLAAAIAVPFSSSLPASLAGFSLFGPYVVLLLGVAISVWFNRGRAFIALCSLLLGYAGYRLAIDWSAGAFAVQVLFTAIAVLVPLNILLAVVFPERGVYQHHNYRWMLVGAAEALLVLWIASAGQSAFSGVAWRGVLDNWLLSSPPTPLAGRLLIVVAFSVAAFRAWSERSPLDIGMAGSLVGLLIACEWSRTPGALGVFFSASGAILLIALLQESHRLAFRDPLTGLPGRRALDERINGLGPVYTIAMVDVDHFKAFNDRHGHDVGDQVLKLVAARLAQIEGGGLAYRYGGEEFSVVFPDRRIDAAIPHLERMRSSIERYAMAVRGPDRPKDPAEGSLLRNTRQPDSTLSVTVSIGVAEPDDALHSPLLVIRAADKALYRAKRAGRNCLSR